MKKKSLGKRLLSALLAFSMMVSAVPAGQLVTFAEGEAATETSDLTSTSATSENVTAVRTLADNLLTANNNENCTTGTFTWGSTLSAGWQYYDGMMLDAYAMLGSRIGSKTTLYSDFVKKAYNSGYLTEENNYDTNKLGSASMGLALFDLIGSGEKTSSGSLTDEEIEALKATPFTVDGDVAETDNTFIFNQNKKSSDFDLTDLTTTSVNGAKATVNNIYDASAMEESNSAFLYCNGVVMTEFRGKLYCQWQTSKINEDDKDSTKVVYRVSDDDGKTWSETKDLSPAPDSDGYYTSGGWYVNDNNTPDNTDDDILVAYLNYWQNSLDNPDNNDSTPPYKGGAVYYVQCDNDKDTWTKKETVKMNDGSDLLGIFEQDPHVLDSGRIVNAAHFQNSSNGGLFVKPIFTDNKNGVEGWMKSDFTMSEEASSSQSKELEPSIFVNEDGNLVMIFRDQNKSYHVLAAVSTDQGVTWSSSVQTKLPDARQKQSAGNLPDGTAYIINCPVSESNSTDTERILRYPLTITLSKDGKNFDKAYVIGSTARVGSVVHEGKAKRNGYHYPKSVVIGDYLYVSYARNKEIAEYVKIPLECISLNSGEVKSKVEDDNKNLIALHYTGSNTTWELDYNLCVGDRIFVDRPKSGSDDKISEPNKYFASASGSGKLPEELIGSVQIRTAVADKGNKSDTEYNEVAKIEAKQKIVLYIGIGRKNSDTSTVLADWMEDFDKTELTYAATPDSGGVQNGITYEFYRKTINAGDVQVFKSMKGVGQWNYIAMAVPTTDSYETGISNIYSKLTTNGNYTKLNACGDNYRENASTEFSLSDAYMAQRFLIECANAVNNGKLDLNGITADGIYSNVYNSLKWIGNNMIDSTTGLYYDSYDTSNNSVSSTFNAKDTGFYAMTLVDTIAMLPDSKSTEKNELKAILKNLFDGMLKYQDSETGMWKKDITSDSNMSFEGSAMMSYALLKAYDESILIDGKYGEAGVKAFNGAVKSSETATLSDETNVDETNASGIAPLMMASVYAKGVSTYLTEGTDNNYTDSNTGITVSGATNADISETTVDTTGTTLSNTKAYNIELDNYTNAEVTVKIPDGVSAKDLAAYLVKNGEYIKVSGVVDQYGNFTFKIPEGGVYVFGSEPQWNELAWKYVETGDEYEVVYNMEKDKEYIITDFGTRPGTKYSLSFDVSDNSKTSSKNSKLNTINDKHTLSNISNDNLWYIELSNENKAGTGRIYCKNGDRKYYLTINEFADLPESSDFYSGKTDDVAKANPSNTSTYYYTHKDPYYANPELNDAKTAIKEGTTILNAGSNIKQAVVKGSLALFASGTTYFIEGNNTSVTDVKLNPNIEESNPNVTGLQRQNNFFFFGKAYDDSNKTYDNQIITTDIAGETVEWKDVAVVIKNDSVTYYVNGEEISFEKFNLMGKPLSSFPIESWYFADEIFNSGYGYSEKWRTNDPPKAHTYGVSILDFISDENTELTLGGYSYAADYCNQYAYENSAGVKLDDVKFYDIPLTADQITDSSKITRSPIAAYSFNETFENKNHVTIENGIMTFGTKGDNTEAQKGNGYVSIVNPYSGMNLSETLKLGEDGYPTWAKGVTITYRVNVNENTNDASLFVFNNDDRIVMNKDDQEKYDYCAEYDKEAEAVGKNLLLTTESNDALTWSVKKTSLGTQISAISPYTNEAVYITASEEAGVPFKAKSDSSMLTLWSKTGNQASTGAQAALAGTLEYKEFVGSSLTIDGIKNNAKIYYRENASAEPQIIAWEDSNVSFSWDKELNTATEDTYILTVKYKDVPIGTITVDVDSIDWKYVDTSIKYELVTEMKEEHPYGYLILPQAAPGYTGQYYVFDCSVSDSGSIDSKYKEVTISNQDEDTGLYAITGVSESNLLYFTKVEDNSQSGKIYIKGSGSTRYYMHVNEKQVIQFVENSENLIRWDVSVGDANNGKTLVKIKNIDGGGGLKTSYNTKVIYDDSSASNVSLFKRVSDKVALVGDTEITEYIGFTDISENSIKAHAQLYYQDINTGEITQLSWSDTNVSCEWKNTLDTTAAGSYVMNVKYNGIFIGSITVNMLAASTSFSSSGARTVRKGGSVDFSDVKYTYGTVNDYLTVQNGLRVQVKNSEDKVVDNYTEVPGTYTAYFYYGSSESSVGEVSIEVADSPYGGLAYATEYPEYPEEGSVRIDKTATNDLFSYYNTGVAKIELDVAGVSSAKGLDVVLVTDLSNSMGRYYKKLDENGNEVDDTDKPGEKLDQAMAAASQFADIILGGNETNSDNNNTLSFVTFGGFDKDNHQLSEAEKGYIDVTQTVFLNVEDAEAAKTSFNNTEFIQRKNSDIPGTSDIIQIGKTNGNIETGYNMGGTNYDYAFAEAAKATKQLQNTYENYAATGRKTIILFMTDGAPTYYNGVSVDGGKSSYIWGTKILYGYDKAKYNFPKDTDKDYTPETAEAKRKESAANWLAHASNINTYAEELVSFSNDFYAIGFEMYQDTTSKHCTGWGIPGFVKVLSGLAGKDTTGQNRVKKVYLASNGNFGDYAEETVLLEQAYKDIAGMLSHSGTSAIVTDEVKSEFTLVREAAIRDLNGNIMYKEGSDSEYLAESTIEVTIHDLYTADTTEDESKIGSRTGASTRLEKVWFEEESAVNGTSGKPIVNVKAAYSDQIYTLDGSGEKVYTNIYNESDGVITISAKYFTYTATPENSSASGYREVFEWNIGDITDKEVSLSYYAYLTGTGEGTREEGIYDTNESAKLDYVDINEKHAVKIFPIPQRSWGDAITVIEYYLVNENGQPVNENGQVVSFANRVIIDKENEGTRTKKVAWENSITVNGGAYVPSGYSMYSPGANYTVNVSATGEGTLSIVDDKSTINGMPDLSTKWTNETSCISSYDESGNPVSYNVEYTRVSFGLVLETEDKIEVNPPIGIDRVVVDYGKPIIIDVLQNNPEYTGSAYSAKVVGFSQYNPDEDLVKYVQNNPGSEKFNADYGKFELVANNTNEVKFTMTKMLDAVQKVFTVVEVTPAGTTNTFYLYQELEVIPATVMYYETDFSDGVFTLSQVAEENQVTIPTPAPTENSSDSETKRVETNYSTWCKNGDSSSDSQNSGAVGASPLQTYGKDSTYETDGWYSNGSSFFVTGEGSTKNSEGKYEYNTTAAFTFTGTGFDIISRTGHRQGMIDVRVYKVDGNTKTLEKKISVLNKSDKEWEIYQIPVVSVEGLNRGTYEVEIAVLSESYCADKTSPLYALLDRGNEFYFDAVRIYDPIYIPTTDGTIMYEFDQYGYYLPKEESEAKNYISAEARTDKVIALSAYSDDGEAYPETYEVRNILIDADTMSGGYEGAGAVVIDENYSSEDHVNIVEMDKLLMKGPNNEVYLKPGQAIAFKLTVAEPEKVASIDIGAKGIITSANQYVGANLNAVITPAINSQLKYELHDWYMDTSTAMYYPFDTTYNEGKTISDMFDNTSKSAYVYIQNGSGATAVLSITDIKIAYKEKPNANSESALATFSVGPDVMAYASSVMFAPDYDIKSAAFESNTCNVFSNNTLVVKTTQDVDYLKVTNRFGKQIVTNTSYEDLEDGTRLWKAVMLMNTAGNTTYVVTGYGEDGSSGKSAQAVVRVTVKEGGGWQDAKSIYKTLFNCRILSIKRSLGNKLQ